MTRGRILLSVVLSGVLFAMVAAAQPEDRCTSPATRILDLLFPLDAMPGIYLVKMVLRFGDNDAQIVAVVYPDKEKYWLRRGEIIRYSLAGMGESGLSQLISKMKAENPIVKDQEIAARVKVNVERFPVAPEALYHAFDTLKPVRISPILTSRVGVDEVSEYEFWYDTGQESVHYVIFNPSGNCPQDKLGRWMDKFRAGLPDLLKATVPKP